MIYTMKREIKRYKKVRKWGDSLAIILDKETRQLLSLEKNDRVLISIQAIEDPELSDFKCERCNHQFTMEKENPYCPACSSIKVIEKN